MRLSKLFNHSLNSLCWRATIFLAVVMSVSPSAAQEETISDMELITRVEELQRELAVPEIPKRDAAEKALIEYGVRVLDYLEPPTDDTPSDAVERINRIRAALEKIAVASVTKSSIVSISGKLTVDEALKKLRQQTGNEIDVREGTPDVFINKEIDLKLEKANFWEATRAIMGKSDLIVDTYGGSPGTLRLTPTEQARVLAANPNLPVPPKVKKVAPPASTSGIFDLVVTRINSSRNLANPDLNFCNVTVRIRWEPRVIPISLDLPAKTIKAIDEFDNPIEITNKEAVMPGTVQPEIPELEFSIPIGLVDRQIETIKSLDAQIDAVLPGRIETFRFKKLGQLAPGAKQTKAGATVTIGGVQKNEDLWGISLTLGFDEGHNALESHQAWVYSNPMYLENKDGEQFTALTYNSAGRTENSVSIQYLFDKNPKDMTLVYKTPALIIEVPVKISLKDIPLP
jgi:hypothetical protein